MSLVINTNIASLTAQQNLQNNSVSLNTSLQRLSSGLRINSAADDAAGLAISDRFTTQINGLGQASKNANDGISLSQTAGGALAQVTANLQSIRQLAVQAANATNSASDRAALDQAVQQDIAEINRIANQTSFNNRNILDGTFGTASFQVGANVGQTISVGLNTSAQVEKIGAFYSSIGSAATTVAKVDGTNAIAGYTLVKTTNTGGVSGTAFDGTAGYAINGTTLQASANFAVSGDASRVAGSAYAEAAAINASGVAGVTATAQNNLSFAAIAGGNAVSLVAGAGGTASYTLTINGVQAYTTGAQAAASTTPVSVATLEAAINQVASQTGVVAGTDASGNVTLSAADGRSITIGESVTNGAGVTSAAGLTSIFSGSGTYGTASSTASETATYTGQVNLSSGSTISLSANAAAALGFTSTVLSPSSNLGAQNVLTVQGANNTIQSVDSALTAIDSLNSTFGAIQNRFQSTIASLGTAVTNLSAARSRIQDADFAAETSNLTRAQILQQAGTSILAQANAVPQGVLKLLQ
jgi:flagellin